MMIGAKPNPYYPTSDGATTLANYNVAMPPASSPSSGHKVNWLGVLADALAGAAGMPGYFAESQQKKKDEQTAFDRGEQQYRIHRQDSNDDWQKRQDYEQAHKDPTGYAAELAQAGYAPGTPDYISKLRDHVNNSLDPFVTVPMANGTFSGPRSEYLRQFGGGAPAAPMTPVGRLRPLGGQTPPASGGFPRNR